MRHARLALCARRRSRPRLWCVHAAEPDGTTPLMQAVLTADCRSGAASHRAGADVRAANRYGVTALSLAALNGNAAIVSALLEAGADPNSTSAEGEPVLMSAARTGNTATVALLLARGADPNAREPWLSQTALMWAAAENHAAVVAALVAQGADPNATSAYFHDWALGPSEPATPKVTTPKGAMTALHYAARQGAIDSVRALLASPKLYVDFADPDGVTALLYATVNGHYDVAMYLLEHGADPTIVDNYGRGVLYAAVDMNRPELEPRPPVSSEDRATALDVAEAGAGEGRGSRRAALRKNSEPLHQRLQLARHRRHDRALACGEKQRRRRGPAAAQPRARTSTLAARDGSTPFMIAAGQSWRDEHSLGSESESIAILTALLGAGAPIGGGEHGRRNGAARRRDARRRRGGQIPGRPWGAARRERQGGPDAAAYGDGHRADRSKRRRRAGGRAAEDEHGGIAARADGGARRGDRGLRPQVVSYGFLNCESPDLATPAIWTSVPSGSLM